MAAPSGAYGEALSATLRKISKVAIDNARQKHPLFEVLRMNAKSERGGEEMVLPVVLGTAAAPSITTSSGHFTATTSANILTSASYEFETVEVSQVRLNWLELEKNSGEARLIDRLALHRDASIDAFRTHMVNHMFTAHGSRAAGSYLSLDSLCNDAVDEVGGIDRTVAGNSAWTPVTQDATSITDIKKVFRTFFQAFRTNSNGRVPDMCIVGQDVWNLILEYLDDKQTIQAVGGGVGEWEWESIRFEGVNIAWDYDCPADQIYGLTKSALHWRWLNDNFLKAEEPQRVSEIVSGVLKNTLEWTYPIVNVFAVGTNERRALGKVENVGA